MQQNVWQRILNKVKSLNHEVPQEFKPEDTVFETNALGFKQKRIKTETAQPVEYGK